MAAPIDVNTARKSLQEELGESSPVYFQNLASWFKKKTSKEDFDLEARKLLTADAVHLHNEFLLAIIAKCQSVSTSMVLSKDAALQSAATSSSKQQRNYKLKRRHRSNMQQRFVAVNPLDFAPKVSPKSVEESSSPLGFVSRDMLLPDLALLHGRALVCAWEMGLQDVQDNVVKIIIFALELQLKKVLSAVMQKRSGYKLREKRFRFALGCGVRNPYLRQASITPESSLNSEATAITNSGFHTPSLKPSVDVADQAAAHELSLVDTLSSCRPPISMIDLLEALQLNRNAIPSHSVYSQAVERIIHRMWHPDPVDVKEEEEERLSKPDPAQIRNRRPAISTLLLL